MNIGKFWNQSSFFVCLCVASCLKNNFCICCMPAKFESLVKLNVKMSASPIWQLTFSLTKVIMCILEKWVFLSIENKAVFGVIFITITQIIHMGKSEYPFVWNGSAAEISRIKLWCICINYKASLLLHAI